MADADTGPGPVETPALFVAPMSCGSLPTFQNVPDRRVGYRRPIPAKITPRGKLRSDLVKPLSFGAKLPHDRNALLLARVRLLCAVGGESIPVSSETACPLPVLPHVLQSVGRPLGDGFPLPLRHASHNVQDKPSGGRGRVYAVGNGNELNPAAVEPLYQVAKVTHRSCDTVQFGDDHDIDRAPLDHVQYLRHAGPFQVLT